jgi:hypothetical protein
MGIVILWSKAWPVCPISAFFHYRRPLFLTFQPSQCCISSKILRRTGTARLYYSDSETGQTLGDSENGLPHTDLWLTTNYSCHRHVDQALSWDFVSYGLESCGCVLILTEMSPLWHPSRALARCDQSPPTFYLIHSPRPANGDIPGLWKKLVHIRPPGRGSIMSNVQLWSIQ